MDPYRVDNLTTDELDELMVIAHQFLSGFAPHTDNDLVELFGSLDKGRRDVLVQLLCRLWASTDRLLALVAK